MSEITVKNISPAVAGWWAKFRDDDGTEWYSPIAAWALCEVDYFGAGNTRREILPVLTSELGMGPHPSDEGYCACLYLPDEKFTLSGEQGSFTWYPVNSNSNNGNSGAES
ncbi:hypothetical protein E8W17_001438 [Escherichia coli]|nr:hypothetical protein [Escherichia coli]